MMKLARFLIALTLIFAITRSQTLIASAKPLASVTADQLIAEVNGLRAANGLPAYSVNWTLMGVAQAHAEYMASIRSVTHYSADGSRPYQRSLAAGYPLAGDLGLGGFHAENIIAGNGMTASEAVQAWLGDAPHTNTMLSENLTEIGAGVAVVDGYYYLVIDCARPTGATSPYVSPTTSAGTSAPPIVPPTQTTQNGSPQVIANTPKPDGSIGHVVQTGETLGSLSVAYDVSLKELYALNNMTEKTIIYVGNVIIIRRAFTVTPTVPSPTFTDEPTITPAPSLTLVPSLTPTLVTSTPQLVAGSSIESTLPALAIILFVALFIPAIIVIASRRKQ
jgi:uncharacterized protein YkwD/LysM repeat protein